MIKSIVKKVLILLLSIIITLIIIPNMEKCYALSDVTEWTWEPTVEGTDALEEKAGPILGVINVVGVIVSVGTLSIIGIKFMLGSVEEKASYKKALVPWVVGATMVFAVTTVPNFIYNVTQSAINGDSGQEAYRAEEAEKWNQYISGWDEEIKFVYERWKSYESDTPEQFANRLGSRKTMVHNAWERNGTPEYLGRYQFVSEFQLEMNRFSTREDVTQFFEQVIAAIEKIENNTITKFNVDGHLRNYPKYSGSITTEKIRIRLECQKREWQGSEYIMRENLTVTF